MSMVTVTRKYQVTIPREARRALGIKVGDRLLVKVEVGRVSFERARCIEDAAEYLWGLADKHLGGPSKADAVSLVEGSLRRRSKAVRGR